MKRLLPIALTLAFAAPAHAAEYRVYACHGPDGRARSMQPFAPFELPGDSLDHGDYCLTDSDGAYFQWAAGSVLTDGQRGGFALAAPAGTSFTQLDWRGSASGFTGTGARMEIARGDDGATLWDSATDFPRDLRRWPLPVGTSMLVLRQACRAAVCAVGPQPARTSIHALTATLDDGSPPTASGFAGTLTETGARRGDAGLTFAAADVGSGLRRAALVVDGGTHAVTLDDSAGCAPLAPDARGYAAPQPCASSVPVTLEWATAGVRDGAHTMSATLEDAAGNLRTVYGPVTVTTDNLPPLPGTVTVSRAGATLTATPTGFDGQDAAYAYRWQRCDSECEDIAGATHARYVLTAADAGTRVRAVVTATDLGGATTARSAPLAIEPAATAHAPAAPSAAAAIPTSRSTPRVTLSRRTIKVAYGKRVEVRGRVTGWDGAPLAGATLDVLAKLRVRGATARREGGIGSASDGRFTYVAPAGASRDLRIAGATVSLLVTASGTLHATRRGGAVTFSGRVRGGHVPRGGVLVEIRAGKHVIALTRTDGRGVYRVTRRATRQSFRARTRADSSWPFVAAPVGSRVSV